MKKVCIIGGGISGLTAAFLLKRRGFEVILFEKTETAGGNIQSREVDGFLIEYAPNSLIKSPRLVDLIRELGLEGEILEANPNNKKRYVLQKGKLAPLPMSIAGLITGSFFSPKAKLRLLKEPFVKSKSSEAESVAAFFERRLGREVVEKAADPFIAGIFAGDPEKLSVKTAFPRLFELERDFGSLLIGSLRSKTEKADKNFPRSFSFKKGIQTLTDRLADFLGESVQTNTSVSSIEKSGEIFVIKTGSDEKTFDAVIISAPAEAAANLIESADADLSEKLKKIYYPPIAMVFFGIEKEKIGFDLDGFGFLVPGAENRKILGTIWNSAVFANRAPAGYDLLTTFVGGARNAELFEKTDEELKAMVFDELKDILNLRGEKPDFAHIKRWRKAIPQYNLGYEKTEKAIEDFSAKNKGIFFCSNFYKGISVGDCVKNAFALAEKIEEMSREQTRKGTK